MKDGKMIAFITERPHYCDRGRWDANVAVPIWRSDADPPNLRYFFNVEYGKEEMIDYLKAKKVDVEGAVWELKEY